MEVRTAKYVNGSGSQISLPSFFPAFNDCTTTTTTTSATEKATTTATSSSAAAAASQNHSEFRGTQLADECVRHKSTKSMNLCLTSRADEMYETLIRQTTKLSTDLVEMRSKTNDTCHPQCRILEERQGWNYVDVLHKCAGIHLRNSTEFHMFYVECLEFTRWMKADIMRCGQYLADVQATKELDERELGDFLENTRELSRILSLWRVKLMELKLKGEVLLPVNLRDEVLREKRSVRCINDYSNEQTSVLEGEELLLVEKSGHNWKVRSEHGGEFFVPSTFLVILGPVPDALAEVVRLNETYGELWVVLRGLARKNLVNMVCSMVDACGAFDEKSWMSMPREKVEKISSIVKLMEEAFGLSWCSQQSGMRERVEQLKSSLDRSLQANTKVYPEDKELLLQMLVKNPDMVTDLLKLFQESWSEKNRFWATKANAMFKAAEQIDEEQQLEAVHAIEEVYQLTRAKVTTETSHLTTSEQQENQTFVVTGVVNPKDKTCISLDEAIRLGIVNQREGKYVGGADDQQKIPIAEAMNQNLIKVERTKRQLLQEKKNDLGFITIKSYLETRPYSIRSVVDPETKALISLEAAVKRGIVDQKMNLYRDQRTKSHMTFEEALDRNLLVVEFEEMKEQSQEAAKVVAYAVYGALDTRSNRWLDFKRAVETGILNPEDGTYVERSSGQQYKFVEAVDRGFVRAPIVPDHRSIDLQALV